MTHARGDLLAYAMSFVPSKQPGVSANTSRY
jgi:hypothetical protein